MGGRLCDQHPCIKTHKKHYKEAKKRNRILIIENVTEYSVDLVMEELGPQWACVHTRLDPRVFGLPVARARLYIIAYRCDLVQWTGPLDLDGFMALFAGQCMMSARNLFWMNLPKTVLSNAEAPWLHWLTAKCSITSRSATCLPSFIEFLKRTYSHSSSWLCWEMFRQSCHNANHAFSWHDPTSVQPILHCQLSTPTVSSVVITYRHH